MYSGRRRRIRVFNPIRDTLQPITNFRPPEWFPLSSYLTRRWERRNRWPPFRGIYFLFLNQGSLVTHYS